MFNVNLGVVNMSQRIYLIFSENKKMEKKAIKKTRNINKSSALAYTGLMVLLWVVLSGHFTPLLLSFGALSCLFVIYMAWRGDVLIGDIKPEQFFLKVPFYWIWLALEILKSNISTGKAIWTNNFEPEIFEVKASQKSENGLANYANSITLTPGTVTVLIKGNIFLVHALTAEMGKDVRSGVMDKKITKMAL